MMLLTKAIMKKLSPLYAQENKGDEAIVHVKFFTPDSNWTWYITEGNPVIVRDGETMEGVAYKDLKPGDQVVNWTFFGWVDGFEFECGYVSLNELESSKGPTGLHIERDLHWRPTTVGEMKAQVVESRR